MIVGEMLDSRDKWQFTVIPILGARIILICALFAVWMCDDSYTFLFMVELLLLLILRYIIYRIKKDSENVIS